MAFDFKKEYKEFYMDVLNCDPMSFDKKCELTNAHFHKNKNL